jgi:four helix bundle protein
LGVSSRPYRLQTMAGDFRKLKVWERSHALALQIDRVAAGIRKSRHVALRSQLTRAAMSIPANIAEGRRQESEREFARFLRYSVNSAYELEYHIVVATDVGVVSESEGSILLKEVIEIRKMLHGLLKKIAETTPTRHKKSSSPADC